MKVYHTSSALKERIRDLRNQGKTIGFVPTMGALHKGHLSLVKRAIDEMDCVVVSIFVNPTQFNNRSDLKKYPRMLEADVELLSTVGEVLVFAPTFDEVYPENDTFEKIDLDGRDSVLEGQFRPGHFQGVVHVVRNLFRIVEPDKAFFGLKDFQQVAIIKLMVKKLNLPVEIVECPTSRAENGLALSSRNMRLNDQQKEDALIIFQTLTYLNSLVKDHSPAEARELAIDFFNKGKLELEYLEIVDGDSLKPLKDLWTKGATCCIAAYCGDVRLIDNFQLSVTPALIRQ